jgi:hypothetical protein
MPLRDLNELRSIRNDIRKSKDNMSCSQNSNGDSSAKNVAINQILVANLSKGTAFFQNSSDKALISDRQSSKIRSRINS